MSLIAIINYGMGNVGSIYNMLKKIQANAIIATTPEAAQGADKLILPGIGAFDHGMKSLKEGGWLPFLQTKAIEEKTPVLGICLGMQLMTLCSEEGQIPGLGWLDAKTVRFQKERLQNQKIPHMGWNLVYVTQDPPIDISTGDRFYFVHSYHVIGNEKNTVARTHYGYDFCSVICQGNLIGAQFHPEKSHRFGMRLLKSFAQVPQYA
ncbi:imidazole glycerol phosphate synthase subunit HisH [Simkania negevensis]|uniref:Imidazole glycerol phosphate synthase subunit HisH n=1 Tax=Simkania negevensis TaxID=83561 RepID=A0ABS3ATJ2_9BACT|nr:imidazole glycerol phosphate synthase subunit HisH [Simkania negevensis]